MTTAAFREYDVVRAKRELESGIPLGSLGAVLMVFRVDPPEYEVEFVDDTGETLGVLTVEENNLEFVASG
ncbi:MAG: DUF4926 domain-containing protein [Aquisalimonadaceae bacterium]